MYNACACRLETFCVHNSLKGESVRDAENGVMSLKYDVDVLVWYDVNIHISGVVVFKFLTLSSVTSTCTLI